MHINNSNNEEGLTTLTVSGTIGIEDIQEFKQVIELRLNNTSGLRILATDLDYFDMSLLQLLVISTVHALKAGKNLDIQFDLDEESSRLITQTGLDKHFLRSIQEKTT